MGDEKSLRTSPEEKGLSLDTIVSNNLLFWKSSEWTLLSFACDLGTVQKIVKYEPRVFC
jgi:hypothetical protein